MFYEEHVFYNTSSVVADRSRGRRLIVKQEASVKAQSRGRTPGGRARPTRPALGSWVGCCQREQTRAGEKTARGSQQRRGGLRGRLATPGDGPESAQGAENCWRAFTRGASWSGLIFRKLIPATLPKVRGEGLERPRRQQLLWAGPRPSRTLVWTPSPQGDGLWEGPLGGNSAAEVLRVGP